MTVLISIGACSQHSQVIVKNRQCGVPARVELTALDNKSHIGSKKNVAVLMINIADLVAYVKSLENAITCFQAQDDIDSSPAKAVSE